MDEDRIARLEKRVEALEKLVGRPEPLAVLQVPRQVR